MINPDGSEDWDGKQGKWSSWCDAVDVDAELVGTASSEAECGVVCASYNAG